MSQACKLKEQADELTKKGLKASDTTTKQQYLVEACGLYAKAIEEIAKLESIMRQTLDNDTASVKPSLFLNLALCNFHLKDFDASYMCANVSVGLCNNPFIKLNELQDHFDAKQPCPVILPVNPQCSAKMGKALYRRGMAQLEQGEAVKALEDCRAAQSILSTDKVIADAIKRIESSLKPSTTPTTDDLPMTNGGYCDSRMGTWTQSIQTLTVHLPLRALQITSKPTVLFHTCSIAIEHAGACVWSRDLKHAIVTSECTWYIDHISNTSYICLHLTKALPESIYPGCEWWECVFDGDEEIDTLTCSVGSDTSELPQHAYQRAYREHQRFQSLSTSDQQKELDYLSSAKVAFRQSEEKTRDAAAIEEKAVAAVPERAEMLQALRDEFPHINFTAK